MPIAGAVVLLALAQKFGILPSGKSLKEAADAEKLVNLNTGPSYIKAVKQGELRKRGLTSGRFTEQLYKQETLPAIALAIYRTRGGIRPDNEAGLYSILRRIPARTALAQVDSFFYTKYGTDLPNFFAGYLNNSELSKVGQIINQMPLGLKFLS